MDKNKRCYILRKNARLSWPQIAVKVGYRSPSGPYQAAKRYARSNGYRWPLKRALSAGELCYLMAKEDKLSWKEIAEITQQKDPRALAKSYADYNRRYWPYWGRFGVNKCK